MKVAFLSDIQTYNRPNAYESGKNILDITLQALEEVVLYCEKQQINTFIHLGDLVEYSQPQEITRIRLLEFFSRVESHFLFSTSGAALGRPSFYTLSGNHDLHRRYRYGHNYPVSVLDSFQKANNTSFKLSNWKKPQEGVLPEGYQNGVISLKSNVEIVYVFMVPYFSVETEFFEAVNDIIAYKKLLGIDRSILCIHQDLSDEIPGSTINPTDPIFDSFDFVLGGHLHHRREVVPGKFYLLGSLLQQKGGDKTNQSKGFYILDTDNFERGLEFIPLTGNYPRFHHLYVGDPIPDELSGQYILRKQTAKQIKEAKEKIPDLGKKVDDTNEDGRLELLSAFVEYKGLEYKEQIISTVSQDIKKLESSSVGSKKFLRYIELEVEGYKSYANPQKFLLSENNFTMYSGENGAGKSTPFRALYWCEAGRSYVDNVTKDDIVTEKWMQHMAQDWKGTRVIVTIEIDGVTHKVCRHINYKGETYGQVGKDSFMVFREKDGSFELLDLNKEVPQELQENIGSRDGKLRDTKLWELYKGVSHKLFLNSILFDSTMVRSILSSNSEKSELLEYMLDIDWVEGLKSLNQTTLEELKRKTNDISQVNNRVYNKYESSVNLLEILKEDRKTKVENEKRRREGIKLSIRDTDKDIEEAQKNIRDKEKEKEHIHTAEQRLTSELDELEAELNEVQKTPLYIDLSEKSEKTKKELYSLMRYIQSNPVHATENKISILEKSVEHLNTEMTDLISLLDRNTESLNKINQLLDNPTDAGLRCEVCGGVLSEDDARDHILKQREAKEGAVNRVTNDITYLNAKLKEIHSTIEEEKKFLKNEEKLLDERQKLLEDKTKQVEEWDIQIEEGEREYRKMSGQLIENIRSKKSELSEVQSKKTQINNDIEYNLRVIASYENNQKNRVKELEDIDEIIKNYNKQKISELTTDIKKLSKDLDDLEKERSEVVELQNIREYISKRILFSKGLRTFAINNKLQQLTEYARRYAYVLNTDIMFYLDSTLSYMAKMSVDGTYRNVHKLSDGQLTIANLIWVFSLNDLIRESVDCSFLFLDEPYTNLDPENGAKVTDLMLEKAKDSHLHLITHSQRINATNVSTIYITGGKTIPTEITKQ